MTGFNPITPLYPGIRRTPDIPQIDKVLHVQVAALLLLPLGHLHTLPSLPLALPVAILIPRSPIAISLFLLPLHGLKAGHTPWMLPDLSQGQSIAWIGPQNILHQIRYTVAQKGYVPAVKQRPQMAC